MPVAPIIHCLLPFPPVDRHNGFGYGIVDYRFNLQYCTGFDKESEEYAGLKGALAVYSL
jgi:hypothetical protein